VIDSRQTGKTIDPAKPKTFTASLKQRPAGELGTSSGAGATHQAATASYLNALGRRGSPLLKEIAATTDV
jgi:hypothetical protein